MVKEIQRKSLMSQFKYIAVLLLSGILASCSNPISYGSDFESGVDFSSMSSFAWHAPNEYNELSNNYIANEIVDSRIRDHVTDVLQNKCFAMISSTEEADFLVNYSIVTTDKIDVRSYNTYAGYGPGWGYGGSYGYYGYPYRYYGVGAAPMRTSTETTVSEYTQGTFVLDIISADEDQLIWRGTAEGKMPRAQLTSSQRESLIAEVVERVLRDFPPTR